MTSKKKRKFIPGVVCDVCMAGVTAAGAGVRTDDDINCRQTSMLDNEKNSSVIYIKITVAREAK